MNRPELNAKQYVKFLEKPRTALEKKRMLDDIVDVRMNEQLYSKLESQMKKIDMVVKFGMKLRKQAIISKSKSKDTANGNLKNSLNLPLTDQEAYVYALTNLQKPMSPTRKPQPFSSQTPPASPKKRRNGLSKPTVTGSMSPKSKKNTFTLQINQNKLTRLSDTFMGIVAAAQQASQATSIDSDRLQLQKERTNAAMAAKTIKDKFRDLVSNKKLPKLTHQKSSSLDHSAVSKEDSLANIESSLTGYNHKSRLKEHHLKQHHLIKGTRYQKFKRMKDLVHDTRFMRGQASAEQEFLKQLGHALVESRKKGAGPQQASFAEASSLYRMSSNEDLNHRSEKSIRVKRTMVRQGTASIDLVQESAPQVRNRTLVNRNPNRRVQVSSKIMHRSSVKAEADQIIQNIMREELAADEMWNPPQNLNHHSSKSELQRELDMMEEREMVGNQLYKKVIVDTLVEKGLAKRYNAGKYHVKLLEDIEAETENLKR